MSLTINEYIEKLFTVWDTIDFIVTENAGGDETKEKLEWFREVCAEYSMDKDNTDPMEFADWIDTILNDEFNVILEDDSSVSIARNIMKYSDALRKDDKIQINEIIQKLLKVIQERSKNSNIKRKVEGDSDNEGSTDDSSDEEMEIGKDKPQKDKKPKQVVDDDGWTTIQRH
ncbi:Pre-rRNA-processing protein TSR2 family-containing protein [Strongyloides ratti]|uniref:Pre-rRNA-processing protein TSR2 homolog n=1 Tax=Strongyloides ratti TaxID=34506 RepID=A0A090KZB4_STRRB|nr:Pre-rRNA-processing protein TSR2 family-containing protein [Strongyloides ratti]CEF62870.1 Pre-rRNA-processing protein TSR2 family-containing protein [Strongyloides ratti]